MTDDTGVDRTDENWKYPYVASVVDFKASIMMNVQKHPSMSVGYQITPEIRIQSPHEVSIGFLDDFCLNHGIQASIQQDTREGRETYRLDLSRRKSIQTFVRLVMPYLIAHYETAELVDELIQGMEESKHSDKEGFVEMMELVDEIRDRTQTRSEPKYTADYFRDEWNV